jgi:hypothetical protein
MQPSALQVERCLRILRAATGPERDNGGSVVIVDDVPSEALRRLAGTPLLRRERLELARQRLFAADRPSAEDIADRLVGRLVCDRLR